MRRNILGFFIITATLLAGPQANAIDFGNPVAAGTPDIGAGLQSFGSTFGLSAKYRYSDKIIAQATIGAVGDVKQYGLRGLYSFSSTSAYDLYGFTGLGIWTWGGGSGFKSESSVGFSAGAGIEYTVPNTTFALSAELGASLVSFDNFGGVSTVTLGLGAHYYF